MRAVSARYARGMALDVAALAAHVVLQPTPCGVEGVAQGDLHLLVVLMRDGDFAARHLEIDAHVELLALALVARAELDHDAAAYDVVVIALELFRLLADRPIQGVGLCNAVQRDLEGDFHRKQPSAAGGAGFDLGQKTSTLSAHCVQAVSSSIVLRWAPAASSPSSMPRASMQVPHTPTSASLRVTRSSMRSML